MDGLDQRGPLVQYVFRDLMRAIDPTAGLATSLKQMREIHQMLKPGHRARKSQMEKFYAFLS